MHDCFNDIKSVVATCLRVHIHFTLAIELYENMVKNIRKYCYVHGLNLYVINWEIGEFDQQP